MRGSLSHSCEFPLQVGPDFRRAALLFALAHSRSLDKLYSDTYLFVKSPTSANHPGLKAGGRIALLRLRTLPA